MLTYKKSSDLDVQKVIMLFESSGIIRPIDDAPRIKEMISNSNLVFTAWNEEKLVGLARCVTDFNYCCYLSDLAVHKDYQKSGIGNHLIELVSEEIGEAVSLILLASESAMPYYPKVGFEQAENAFIIKRKY